MSQTGFLYVASTALVATGHGVYRSVVRSDTIKVEDTGKPEYLLDIPAFFITLLLGQASGESIPCYWGRLEACATMLGVLVQPLWVCNPLHIKAIGVRGANPHGRKDLIAVYRGWGPKRTETGGSRL